MNADRNDRASLRANATALNRAFEFALTTAIFAAAGFGLDHWLGTTPVLLIVLALAGVVGQFVRSWYVYDAEMREHEAALGLTSARRSSSTARSASAAPSTSTPQSTTTPLPSVFATMRLARRGLARRRHHATPAIAESEQAP